MSEGWGEGDSGLYRAISSIAVPAREEQLATIACLLPFEHEERFRVVELGAGEGMLAHTILDCYPGSSVLALDGSDSMRERAACVLARFGGRAAIDHFDLASQDWLPHLDGADAVVSSLTLHHLSGTGKRRLFEQVATQLPARGALLIADLVEPQRGEVRALFAATWDREAEQRSPAGAGPREPFEAFQRSGWNLFRHPDPEVDKPSPLADQLSWLAAAGFPVVDCFWLRAGHAIYGGYRARGVSEAAALPFTRGLEAARAAVEAGRVVT
ncbi:MAG: trans-aconitate 2-methyltransferase [Actinomycetota bacterium]